MVAAPAPARAAGRAVLLIPHRGESLDEAAPPGDYPKILAIERAADGPVQVRAMGEESGWTWQCTGSWNRYGRK